MGFYLKLRGEGTQYFIVILGYIRGGGRGDDQEATLRINMDGVYIPISSL